VAAAAAVFAALAVILTWPQAVQLAGISTHPDSLFNLWRLAWIAHALGGGHRLFDANIFWPEHHTFAYSDAMLAEGVLGAPLLWAGMSTPVALNLLLLVSFVFSGMAAWALVRHLTGSWISGIVAGVIFAFAPFRFDHYGHFELLWSGWMPLAVLTLVRAIEEGRFGWGLATGVLLALQVLSSIYYGVFLAVVLAVVAIVLGLARPRSLRPRAAAGFVAGGALAAAMLVPYSLPYHSAKERVGTRPDALVAYWSAGPKQFLAATPGNWLYGGIADRFGRHEKRLFPGLVATLLAGIALWPPIDRRRLALATGLVVSVDLSLGTNGITYPLLRGTVEVFQGLRVPARAAQVMLLSVAALAGFGLARIEPWFRRRRRAAASATLLVSLLALEYATMPVPLAPAPPALPVSTWLAGQPDGVVVGLPLPADVTVPRYDMEFMYQSTFHWKPLVNGSSGNDSPRYYELMKSVGGVPSDAGIDALRDLGVRYVIVHERWFGSDVYRAVLDTLDRRRDLARRGAFPDGARETVAYELIR
jgi:hypothetical protein